MLKILINFLDLLIGSLTIIRSDKVSPSSTGTKLPYTLFTRSLATDDLNIVIAHKFI